jgi:hypothetical protein
MRLGGDHDQDRPGGETVVQIGGHHPSQLMLRLIEVDQMGVCVSGQLGHGMPGVVHGEAAASASSVTSVPLERFL